MIQTPYCQSLKGTGYTRLLYDHIISTAHFKLECLQTVVSRMSNKNIVRLYCLLPWQNLNTRRKLKNNGLVLLTLLIFNLDTNMLWSGFCNMIINHYVLILTWWKTVMIIFFNGYIMGSYRTTPQSTWWWSSLWLCFRLEIQRTMQ